jgi:tetratricopeptide (TPR) repeat protein
MRAFVFTDEALAKHAGQFVWLSIDTEKSGNAAFSKKYPIKAWPSMYVIDPERETIVLRWVGGATVSQLQKLFAQGEQAVRRGRRGSEEALAKADALYGAGSYAEAIPAYRAALKGMPVSAPEYARSVEALLYGLQVEKLYGDCVAFVREAGPTLRGTPSAGNLAGTGLDCALRMPKDAAGRPAAITEFEAQVKTIVADTRLPLAADDRSAYYSLLVDAREEAKDEAGARVVAREWVAYLDGVAAGITDPEQRTALDPNRLGAYQAAGEIAKAIPMLEQSEKDFPKDYNPPARLALVYLRLKRYDEGLVATDRALALVYGPRRVRVLEVQADLYKGRGDAAAARKTLQEALTFAEELPAGQRSDSQVSSLRKKLDEAGRSP